MKTAAKEETNVFVLICKMFVSFVFRVIFGFIKLFVFIYLLGMIYMSWAYWMDGYGFHPVDTVYCKTYFVTPQAGNNLCYDDTGTTIFYDKKNQPKHK